MNSLRTDLMSNRTLAIVFTVALSTAACGSTVSTSDSGAATTPQAPSAATVTSGANPETTTNTQTAANDDLAGRSKVVLNAKWGPNVTVAVDGATVTFTSDGVPSHEYLTTYLADGRDGKYIAGGVKAYNARFQFPVVPTKAAAPVTTGNGAIGVAISGAVFFDPYEGDGTKTVANDDNSVIDGIPFIDACGGHPLPNGTTYHYHGIPFCISDTMDTPGQHSALIGYLSSTGTASTAPTTPEASHPPTSTRAWATPARPRTSRPPPTTTTSAPPPTTSRNASPV